MNSIVKLVHSIFKKDPHLTYLQKAYPSNHTYTIRKSELKPYQKLKKRYKKILSLYPEPFSSLLDIGCAKGFFVFKAAQTDSKRNMGIDVHTDDITACQWVEKKLEIRNTFFAKMQLHELADNIQPLGGFFQTVLVLNTYQYLYFGSRDYPVHYGNHDLIFQALRKVCYGQVIFNNRLEFSECQQQIKVMPHVGAIAESYTESHIKNAALKYFNIEDHGTLGGYPLWVLKPRDG